MKVIKEGKIEHSRKESKYTLTGWEFQAEAGDNAPWNSEYTGCLQEWLTTKRKNVDHSKDLICWVDSSFNGFGGLNRRDAEAPDIQAEVLQAEAEEGS